MDEWNESFSVLLYTQTLASASGTAPLQLASLPLWEGSPFSECALMQ